MPLTPQPALHRPPQREAGMCLSKFIPNSDLQFTSPLRTAVCITPDFTITQVLKPSPPSDCGLADGLMNMYITLTSNLRLGRRGQRGAGWAAAGLWGCGQGILFILFLAVSPISTMGPGTRQALNKCSLPFESNRSDV